MQQTVLIVGGTSGLGRGLCEAYCKEGYKVGIIGRRKHLLDELQSAYPAHIHTFQYDISSETSASDISNIIQHLKGIDKLILTASIVDFNPSFSFSVEQKIVDINIYGYVAVLNAAFHYFSSRNSGHIIAVTSVAAARGNKTAIAYNASKSFQSLYLEGMHLKILSEKRNIHLTEIIPGYIDTEMGKGDRMFWVTKLDKAVNQTKLAIEKKKRRAFITKRWQIIFFILRNLPYPLYKSVVNSNFKLKNKL